VKTVVKTSAAEARLREILPDELTPREALALVYELRDLAGD
jgi:DNA mismatch repair protein MutS